MDYEDEKIAELKKQLRRNKYKDIKGEGVFINDQLVKFCLRNINNGTALYLPEDFIDMPEEIKLMKYPSVNRPQRIITSLDSSVNFVFSLVEQQMSDDQIKSLTDQMKELIHKSNPSVVFYREDREILDAGRPVFMFDFKSFGIDEQMYNMVCYTSLSCGVLHGTFICLDRDSENWKDMAWEAFQTIIEIKAHEKRM